MARVDINDLQSWTGWAKQAGFKIAPLSRTLKIGPRQLRRYTKHLFGLSPKNWLRERRLTVAAKMLDTEHSIKVIAVDLGFKSVSHFSREFKRFYGLSPTSFFSQERMPAVAPGRNEPMKPSQAQVNGKCEVHWSAGRVVRNHRELRNGHLGCAVWLTGLSASGKSTIAMELERRLFELGKHVFLIDGDNMRHGLCANLGFSAEDRAENVRRVSEVSRLFVEAGIICIAALISPYRTDREMVRTRIPPGRFIEVFVNAPLKVCEARDPKGLYVRARAGNIQNFTGISAPYEKPLCPDVEVRTDKLGIDAAVAKVFGCVIAKCGFPSDHAPAQITTQRAQSS